MMGRAGVGSMLIPVFTLPHAAGCDFAIPLM